MISRVERSRNIPHMSAENSFSLMIDFPTCDLVLPVFNGLTYVKDCLASILAGTQDAPYHLYIRHYRK